MVITDGVLNHVGVVEETITCRRLLAGLAEFGQFFVGVPVARAGETVQAEVLKLAGGGRSFQRVNDVNELYRKAVDSYWR